MGSSVIKIVEMMKLLRTLYAAKDFSCGLHTLFSLKAEKLKVSKERKNQHIACYNL